MRSFKMVKAFLGCAALLVSVGLMAAQPSVATLSPAQPGGAGGKIEVLVFFSYACSHCNKLDPVLEKWLKSQKDDVVFRRVPVSFGRASWANLARMYTTLDAMKLAGKHNPAVFDAIHKGQVRLDDEKTRNEWLAKSGVNVKAFNDTWRSFGVESLSRRNEQLVMAYKINGVPALAINGKYVVLGDDSDTLKAVDSLIAKERSAK